MKHAFFTLLFLGLAGCGTLSYNVRAPQGKRAYTEIQWRAVEIKFNELWADLLK